MSGHIRTCPARFLLLSAPSPIWTPSHAHHRPYRPSLLRPLCAKRRNPLPARNNSRHSRPPTGLPHSTKPCQNRPLARVSLCSLRSKFRKQAPGARSKNALRARPVKVSLLCTKAAAHNRPSTVRRCCCLNCVRGCNSSREDPAPGAPAATEAPKNKNKKGSTLFSMVAPQGGTLHKIAGYGPHCDPGAHERKT